MHSNWKLKQKIKFWLGNSYPPTRGRITYFGVKLNFSPGHELFERICGEGVYEAQLLNMIRKHLPPEGVLFDVGANIGLTAIPVLRGVPNCKVVSFEPSPNSLPYLTSTHSGSDFKNRWTLVPKAVGEFVGETEFSINEIADGAFDGRSSTKRKQSFETKMVPMTTLDQAWTELGRPQVSVVKIDVEGFEKEVLCGAVNFLANSRPVIILEWSRANLSGLGRPHLDLLEIAQSQSYEVISLPSERYVSSKAMLEYEMISTEDFLLYPMPEFARN